MNLRQRKYFLRDGGFTLIELLAVIAIIGIITGMIVQLAPAVNQNKKRQRVDAEKNKLILFIDNYKAKFGHLPPDNVNLTNFSLSAKDYDKFTQINPLLYELMGGSNYYSPNGQPGTGNNFYAVNGYNFKQSEIADAFGGQGIMNSDAELQVIYKPLPSPNAYMNYPSWLVAPKDADVQGLVVPVDMVQAYDPKNAAALTTPTTTNFWHYDATSTNRHNLAGYDLWAEFVLGRIKGGWLFVTNGNW